MKTDFENSFADFLEERLGSALFTLRERNVDYRKLSDKYEELLSYQYQNIDEYRAAITQIADIGGKLCDMEKRLLFLAGMREYRRIVDALSSDEFERLFTE